MVTVTVPSIKQNYVKFSIHGFRQFLATITAGFIGFGCGLVVGHSAVLLPQLDDDDTFPYDTTYDSWIASVIPLSMTFGCACAGPVIDNLGRRLGLILFTAPFVVGWAIQATATNVEMILSGRIFAGVCTGAIRPIALVYLSEVTDPKHRAAALISTSFSINFGILMSHVVGTYVYWKLSMVIFCVPAALSLVLLLFLKESPLWLISKRKYDTGIEIFHWYRTKTEAADRELEEVINKQKRSVDWSLKLVFTKPFLKSLIICAVLISAVQLCGINTIAFYASDMLKSTFSTKVDAFLIMVIIDTIRVSATIFIFAGVKCISRRQLFLFCSFGTSIVLMGLVSYIYFNSYGLVWLGLTSMVIYVALSSILISTAWSFPSEIYANNMRGIGSAMTSFMSNILLFIAVKTTPGIIESYGITVLYIGNAVITFVCSLVLCFILPETNKKSLQEIEDSLNMK